MDCYPRPKGVEVKIFCILGRKLEELYDFYFLTKCCIDQCMLYVMYKFLATEDEVKLSKQA